MRKRGNILAGNVIFIILNLLFLSILIGFVYLQTDNAAEIEERYSKNIALLIDSAKPVMEIKLNMKDAIEKAESNKYPVDDIVRIVGNEVFVQLRDNGAHSYSFFNDVELNEPYRDGDNFVIIITGYK